jgi:FKBP-type peptidyl-prolyl cis-trans isomerase
MQEEIDQKINFNYIGFILFIVSIAVVIFLLVYLPSKSSKEPVANISENTQNTPMQDSTPNPNVKIETVDQKVGAGDLAVSGKKVTVNYTGKLTDGTTFDSNVDPKFNHVEPFSFNLGAGEVIKGWDLGVSGMKVGGKRKLTIPPDFGYGASGAGSVIPPNATLIFEVELLKVE